MGRGRTQNLVVQHGRRESGIGGEGLAHQCTPARIAPRLMLVKRQVSVHGGGGESLSEAARLLIGRGGHRNRSTRAELIRFTRNRRRTR